MNRKSWIIFGVTAAMICGTAVLLTSLKARQRLGKPGVRVVARPVHDPKGNVIGTNCVDLPAVVLDYTSEQLPIDFTVLNWLPKDTTYGQRLYKGPDGFQTLVNAVLMGTDRTSIHKPDYCLVGQGWQLDASQSGVTSIRISAPHPYDLPITKLVTTRDVRTEQGQRLALRGVFAYWLVADSEIEPYHNRIMTSIMKRMLMTGELQRWAYVTCFATCLPGQEEATFNRLKAFLADAVPKFQLTSGAPAPAGAQPTMAATQ